MAKHQKKEKLETDQDRQKQENKDLGEVDPYTGEVEPPAEAAYQVTEIVPEDPGNHAGENYLLRRRDPVRQGCARR